MIISKRVKNGGGRAGREGGEERRKNGESEKKGAIEGVQRCERSFSMAECFKLRSGRAWRVPEENK